jgi:hypothetical protein
MDTVHALRGVVVPLMVAIPGTWRISDDAGNITDEGVNGRLDRLGGLVVEPAQSLSAPMESAA